MRYSDLKDSQICELIENRWVSASTVWDEVQRVTKKNTLTYKGDMEWHRRARIPPSRPKITSNRVFVNTEAVINSLIANPPKPNVIPAREGEEAKNLSHTLEKALNIKYDKLNVKEVIRQSLRDLYLSRLFVIKPFWNAEKNDVDVRRVDPKKVRFSSTAKNEEESEFAIEEIETTLLKLIETFPDKKQQILESSSTVEDRLLIDNPTCSYKECWIGNELFTKYKGILLYKGNNPYWDWDGLLATREEMETLDKTDGTPLSQKLGNMRAATMPSPTMQPDTEQVQPEESVQTLRRAETDVTYESYLFNYFDRPRKPYIFATVLNNEDKPIGMTSFIEQATSLQEAIDRIKYSIFLNTEVVNGITKVDASVMSKADAQTLRYDAGGVMWGKGVVAGVVREFGTGLPAFVFEDMQDSRSEIDNIMAASSAFRGEREGQETKAGRLALIEQSFLRLNEMVQVIDFVSQELFGWWMQLMKTKYTEKHLIKDFGPDEALQAMSLMQDDIENGVEVRVIPGKTLPLDRQFTYERAQEDIKEGLISPLDYLEEAGYQNPKEKARNAYLFRVNPAQVLGISDQVAQLQGAPAGAIPAPGAQPAPPQGQPAPQSVQPQPLPVGS